jgi:hypothetical protein
MSRTGGTDHCDRGEREELLFFSLTEESAKVILRVSNGVRAFALAAEIVLDQTVERWKRLMILLKRAVLGIRALESFRKYADSGLEIFPCVGREGWGKLVMELSEQHSRVLIQDYCAICR